MKFALIALVAAVSAANKAVTQEFPSNCDAVAVTKTDPFAACTGSVCCAFSDSQGSNLKRCMTPAQRNAAWSGKYIDDQEGSFAWTCPQPAAAPAESAAADGATTLVASVAGVLSLAAMNM